jgi:hypothetical protein
MAAVALLLTSFTAMACQSSSDTFSEVEAAGEVITRAVDESPTEMDREVLKALKTLGGETRLVRSKGIDMMVVWEKDTSLTLVIPSRDYLAQMRPEVFSALLYHELVHLSRERNGQVDHNSMQSWLDGEYAANEAQLIYMKSLLRKGYTINEPQTPVEDYVFGGQAGFLVDLALYERDPKAWKEIIHERYMAAAEQIQEAGYGYRK